MAAEVNKAWDPQTMGYNSKDFRMIDPDTINPNDYARSLRGEEQHFGDVREYNSGYNKKHPDNDVALDWLGRVGTVFSTEAETYQGLWHVTNMPTVRAPNVFCRAVKVETADEDPTGKPEQEISCVALGVAVNDKNLYEQVLSKIVKKGDVSRHQRVKLTKKI